MPVFKRTRSKVDETDSEPGGTPTIGKRSNKRNKALGNAPAADRELRGSPQKLAVYIVAVKLGPDRTVAGLSKLVKESADYALAKNAEEADVVVTGIGMRQRLERSISTELIDRKPIVKPEWLEKSIRDGKRQPYNKYRALHIGQGEMSDDAEISDNRGDDSVDEEEVVTSAQADLSPNAKFACQRESPLVCPNQELIEQIDVIRRARELDMNWQSALSYARAIAVGSHHLHLMPLTERSAYPRKIESAKEAGKLWWIGNKTERKVAEYLKYGQIRETKSLLEDEKYKVLREFTSIYGIGPVTAQALHAHKCRTLEDVKEFYENPENTTQQSSQDEENEYEDENRRVPERWIEVSLTLKDDLSIKIPRKEVAQIARTVMKELEAIQPGFSHTIAGGYRRGKPESNDIDIVVTYPKADGKRTQELCQELTDVLSKKGLVTHLMTLTGQNTPNSSHSDVLAKTLTVFSLPGSNRSRRLDLIFAVPEVYWTAVVGWTGSTMFQRDLRLHAKSKGLKFDSSGITRRKDQSVIVVHSERDVFEILGLPYIRPTMRNADA